MDSLLKLYSMPAIKTSLGPPRNLLITSLRTSIKHRLPSSRNSSSQRELFLLRGMKGINCSQLFQESGMESLPKATKQSLTFKQICLCCYKTISTLFSLTQYTEQTPSNSREGSWTRHSSRKRGWSSCRGRIRSWGRPLWSAWRRSDIL